MEANERHRRQHTKVTEEGSYFESFGKAVMVVYEAGGLTEGRRGCLRGFSMSLHRPCRLVSVVRISVPRVIVSRVMERLTPR